MRSIYTCFACAKDLGYVYVHPCQAPIDGSLEAFWDSAKFYNESEQGPSGTCNVRMSVCNVTQCNVPVMYCNVMYQ